jgi:hypothetical protein
MDYHFAILGQVATRYDRYFGGHGTVAGTVTVKGSPNTPVSRRVRLYEKRSGMMIRETWSDASGVYAFRYLSMDYTYYVTAFDHTNVNEAVAADNLKASV